MARLRCPTWSKVFDFIRKPEHLLIDKWVRRLRSFKSCLQFPEDCRSLTSVLRIRRPQLGWGRPLFVREPNLKKCCLLRGATLRYRHKRPVRVPCPPSFARMCSLYLHGEPLNSEGVSRFNAKLRVPGNLQVPCRCKQAERYVRYELDCNLNRGSLVI